jgi:membrane-associated phospholipid phosphatase
MNTALIMRKLAFQRQHTRPLFILGAAALLVGLFLKLTAEIRAGAVDALDLYILTHIVQARIPALDRAAVAITTLGSPPVLTLFIVLGLLFFLIRKNQRDALFLAVGSLAIPLLTNGLKPVFSRPRPPDAFHLVDVTSFSYPSGHAGGATVCYLLIAILLCQHYSSARARMAILITALGIVAAVGFSRLYLGVHYPSDIFSGFLLGAGWVLIITAWRDLSKAPSGSGDHL